MIVKTVAFLFGSDVPVPASDGFVTSREQVAFRHDVWGGVLVDNMAKWGLLDCRAMKDNRRFGEYIPGGGFRSSEGR